MLYKDLCLEAILGTLELIADMYSPSANRLWGILVLYRDNGKENGNYCLGFRV